jgi:hypothetical protein
MRTCCRGAGGLCLALLVAGVALGQRPFGPGGGADPAGLLRNPGVRKELKVTDEQLKKVDDAVLKALGEVLEPDQYKRLQQITLQLKGAQAFTDPKVQTALKLSDEQKESIQTIVADSEKEIRELAKEGFQGFGKMGTVRKETLAKVTGVLNAQQRDQWQEMTGPEFQMGPPGFGPGGFGKKGRPKKEAE